MWGVSDEIITPPDYSDETRYKRLANGAIYDREVGRIVSNPGGGTTAITQARSSELRSLWKASQARSRLRGLVRGVCDADGKQIDVSDIDDELIMQANDAAEALTAHMVRTFLASKNLRGMGETYTKLMGLDDRPTDDSAGSDSAAGSVTALLVALRDVIAAGQQHTQRETVEGSVRDVDEAGRGDG